LRVVGRKLAVDFLDAVRRDLPGILSGGVGDPGFAASKVLEQRRRRALLQDARAVGGNMKPENREWTVGEFLFDSGVDGNLPEMVLTKILIERVDIVAQPLPFAFSIGRRIVGEEIDRRAVGRPRWRGAAIDPGVVPRDLARRATVGGDQPDLTSALIEQRTAVGRPAREQFA